MTKLEEKIAGVIVAQQEIQICLMEYLQQPKQGEFKALMAAIEGHDEVITRVLDRRVGAAPGRPRLCGG
jgi:hypothetical protein